MILEQLVRKNIWNLKPYSSARDEYQGDASVFLDANENPYNGPYNRYPDPLQRTVKEKIAAIKKIRPEQIMLGNGSDEPIDLAIRIFCEPGIDNIVAIDPTYGMYQVAANTNHVEYRQVLLDEHYDFKSADLLSAADERTKIVFLCSPNNPTGNSLNETEIIRTLNDFPGIVILDEAYIDFSSRPSFLQALNRYPNLIILQTFSKAWGSAGVRLGMAFASEEIIRLFNKVKYPYNINRLTQEYALKMLDNHEEVQQWVDTLLQERQSLKNELSSLSVVQTIYPSDANFLLVKVDNANATYQYLVEEGVIVRNRNNISLCMDCIRITVGTKEENQELLKALKKLKTKSKEL